MLKCNLNIKYCSLNHKSLWHIEMSFNLPNPCLLAIILTISTHDGPQFVFQYPPDPDSHGYQAAPLVNDPNNSSSSSSSDEFSDEDEIEGGEDSDNNIPTNYEEETELKDSDNSSSSTDNTSDKVKRKGKKKKKSKLTRSDTNPLNPIHRNALIEAKLIGEIERSQLIAAATEKDIKLGTDGGDDDGGLEVRSRHNSNRRRSSMTEGGAKVKALLKENGARRHSSHGERPTATVPYDIDGCAIDDDDSPKPEISNSRPEIGVKQLSQAQRMQESNSQEYPLVPTLSSHTPIGSAASVGSRGSRRPDSNFDASGSSHGENSPILPWKTVLGFKTQFLGELLSPSKYMCNKRFELTVDDMAFLGYPIHILPDGNWKNKTPRRKQRLNSLRSLSKDGTQEQYEDDEADDELENNDLPKENLDDSLVLENIEESDINKVENGTHSKTGLLMFNIVFVLNPPVIEYSFRIEEMYHHIVSKFVGSLRNEQAKSDYVGKEVSKITAVREQASREKLSAIELWENISRVSPLAVSISQLYEAVTSNDIANLTIHEKLRSFQIPIQTQFPYLPAQTEKVFTGTYLTTMKPFEEAYLDSRESISRFALLLLVDGETIIRELHLDNTDKFARMIRSLDPTRTLSQLSSSNNISITSYGDLAYNLIYWRKARAINPISHKNTYIVSPLSPLAHLYHFARLFKSKFPTLLPLPQILTMLSTGKPEPYHMHVPSKDQREKYMEVMAWLLKYGFTTQLRRFVWIKIPKSIKEKVNKDIQEEEERREFELERSKRHLAGETSHDDFAFNKAHDETEPLTFKKTANLHPATPITPSLLQKAKSSPQVLPKIISSTLGDELSEKDTLSLLTDDYKTSEHSTSAAINMQQQRLITSSSVQPMLSSSLANSYSARRSFAAPSDDLPPPIIEYISDTILLDPTGATALQMKWINKILETKPIVVVNIFWKLFKYMDGKNAIDEIDGVSRQEVKKFMSSFGEYIVVARHW